MEGSELASREEIKSILAPLFNMEWPGDEAQAQKAKELFARYFNRALDDIFRDREERNHQYEDSLIKQVALQMDKVLTTLKVTPEVKQDVSESGNSSH